MMVMMMMTVMMVMMMTTMMDDSDDDEIELLKLGAQEVPAAPPPGDGSKPSRQ